ncbi:MAG: phosphate ABC transporter ATP-binding protein PstB [Chloroflexi bacterium]|nr:phosphate ABC transporter ATP-binding protein PstB [Chloroflexota bacterium]
MGQPSGQQTKLATRDLKVWFGAREVLHSISVEIPEHRITALIGPTGCGKSTWIRTVNRLNDDVPGFCHEGAVLLDGQDVYQARIDVREHRRRVGMVFQRPNPFPQSIFENIALPVRIHRIVPRGQVGNEVERLLREVGLWDGVKDKLHGSPFGLSGGQQQLLCVARTLSVRPEVVLMDEPTSSLDPISTQRIEELLLHLKLQTTVVIVTHNLQQASRVGDRVMFLYAGSLVEVGDKDQVFVRPRDARTEAYVTGRMG